MGFVEEKSVKGLTFKPEIVTRKTQGFLGGKQAEERTAERSEPRGGEQRTRGR